MSEHVKITWGNVGRGAFSSEVDLRVWGPRDPPPNRIRFSRPGGFCTLSVRMRVQVYVRVCACVCV